MDKNTRMVFTIGAALGIISLFWYTQSQTSDGAAKVPLVQTEAQVMGMGVNADIQWNAGTNLDMRPELHFWSPGFNAVELLNSVNQAVTLPHRYPAIPGANVSAVLHHGWSQFCGVSPDDDWRFNPPEAAVL